MIAASAFADSRPQDQTWRNGSSDSYRDRDHRDRDDRDNERYRDNDRNRDDRSYRRNERVTREGRISSLHRERDGFRVQLDGRGQSFYVPQSYLRNRARDFRVGVTIRLAGIFLGSYVAVDTVSWPGEYRRRGGYGYRDEYVRGVIEDVDRRDRTIRLRDYETRRVILVDMRDAVRGSRIGMDDIRRGDVIALSGRWSRGGVFDARDIESIRPR